MCLSNLNWNTKTLCNQTDMLVLLYTKEADRKKDNVAF